MGALGHRTDVNIRWVGRWAQAGARQTHYGPGVAGRARERHVDPFSAAEAEKAVRPPDGRGPQSHKKKETSCTRRGS